MALEYAHTPSCVAVKRDAASVALDDEGGTVVVPAAGLKLAIGSGFWEIYHTGKDGSDADSTALLFACRGSAVPSTSVPSDNTNATKRASWETGASKGVVVWVGPDFLLNLITSTGTIRARLARMLR